MRPCDYYPEFARPKIVYPQIMIAPSFAWDEDGTIINQKCFIITNVDKYLLGVLNSTSCWELVRDNSPKLRGGYSEPRKEFMLDVPVPIAVAAERSAIEHLVQECLNAGGLDCDEHEREIDERVARLYGLSLGNSAADRAFGADADDDESAEG